MSAVDQRLNALAQANRCRVAIADAKRSLAAQPTREKAAARLKNLLLCGPPALESARVEDLLRACRGFGVKRSRVLLAGLGISPLARVRNLSGSRREMVVAALSGRVCHSPWTQRRAARAGSYRRGYQNAAGR